MTIIAQCLFDCGNNPVITLPPEGYPGFWNQTPADPNAMTMYCPTIPDMAAIGPTAPDTTVMVQDKNFTNTCVVYLDAVAQTTTFISSSALSFVVRSSTVTAPGTSTVTVVETAP